MMAAWTYEADSSYEIAYVGVTGEPYTSYTASLRGERPAGERVLRQRHDGGLDV